MVQPSHAEPGGNGVDCSRSTGDSNGQGKILRVQGLLQNLRKPTPEMPKIFLVYGNPHIMHAPIRACGQGGL